MGSDEGHAGKADPSCDAGIAQHEFRLGPRLSDGFVYRRFLLRYKGTHYSREDGIPRNALRTSVR